MVLRPRTVQLIQTLTRQDLRTILMWCGVSGLSPCNKLDWLPSIGPECGYFLLCVWCSPCEQCTMGYLGGQADILEPKICHLVSGLYLTYLNLRRGSSLGQTRTRGYRSYVCAPLCSLCAVASAASGQALRVTPTHPCHAWSWHEVRHKLIESHERQREDRKTHFLRLQNFYNFPQATD